MYGYEHPHHTPTPTYPHPHTPHTHTHVPMYVYFYTYIPLAEFPFQCNWRHSSSAASQSGSSCYRNHCNTKNTALAITVKDMYVASLDTRNTHTTLTTGKNHNPAPELVVYDWTRSFSEPPIWSWFFVSKSTAIGEQELWLVVRSVPHVAETLC